MFPMGIRIFNKNKMIYPVNFSVYLDLANSISSINTIVEGNEYQTFNYMMLTTCTAMNGYVYEKDIVMIDGDDKKVGVVVFDTESGEFCITLKDEKITINKKIDFCEILGNVYEDKELLSEYDIVYKDDIIENKVVPNVVLSETKLATPESLVEEKIKPNKNTLDEKKDINIIEDKQEVMPELPKEDIAIEPTDAIESNDEIIAPDVIKEENTSPDEFCQDKLDSNLLIGFEEDLLIETPAPEVVPEKKAQNVVIYAIGYCMMDNGPGGIAYTIDTDGDLKKHAIGFNETTATRVQLLSIIEALKDTGDAETFTVISDSNYAVYPFTKKWIYKWQAQGWKKDQGKTVQNDDLWQEIIALIEGKNITFKTIKSVQDDELALDCRERAAAKAQ